jgi:hypothetical protein
MGNKITPAATGVKLREAISSGQNIFAFLWLSIPTIRFKENSFITFLISKPSNEDEQGGASRPYEKRIF